MKALGKCLICRDIIAKEEIPPQHAKIYLSLTQTFITFLSGKELVEKSAPLPHHLLSAVFPFCKQCRKIVARLHRNHFHIQTGLSKIQQAIENTPVPRSFCDDKKNKVTSCAKTEGVSTELSIEKPDASDVHLQEASSACSSKPNPQNGVELLGSDSYLSSNHEKDSEYAVKGSECSEKELMTAETTTASKNHRERRAPVSVEMSKSSDGKTSHLKKKQQNRLLLLKPGVKPVAPKDALMQTGPGTFIYLNEFGIRKVEDGHMCCTCGYKHVKRGEIRYHIRMTHAPPLPYRRNILLHEKIPNMWYYGEFVAEKVGDEYHCTTCNFISKCRKSTAVHLRKQHYVVAHPDEVASTSFVCEVCGKILATAFTLKQHLYSHDDKPIYTCKDCGERFNTWGKFALHTRNHLGEEGKKFICERCGRKFWQQSTLKNHLFQHTGEREFICKTCGKSYKSSGGLYKHLDCHAGKKYFCDLCNMEFTMSDSVLRHKRVAHGVHDGPSTRRKKATLNGDL